MDPRQAWSFAEQAAEEPIEVQDYYEAMQMEWLAVEMAEEGEQAESSVGP
jgi:hypothetical protein